MATSPSPFGSADTYTQYELLEPGSAKFRVTYYVTERTCVPCRALPPFLPPPGCCWLTRPSDAPSTLLTCRCWLLAASVGAVVHLNGTRPGSEETDLSARDVETCEPISATLVSGAELAAAGEAAQVGNGDPSRPDSLFSRIELRRRPLAAGAEARLRVNKTYRDPLSYYVDEEDGGAV